MLLSGCVGFPPLPPAPPSRALPASTATPLGRIAQASLPDAERTGFRLLPGGDFALDTRLQLIRRAERSLDVQYYQVADDATGRSFLRALRDAARRGVRVRLLLDDLYTAGQDPLLLGLAATPNLELRLFNPFPAWRGSLVSKLGSSLLSFTRLNRRMHNKLFIADGAMAIAGGRNIGGAYFRQTTEENYLDVDAFVTGALLPRLGELFDRYWNSEHVRPIESVVPVELTRSELERRFEQSTEDRPTLRAPEPGAIDALGYLPVAHELDAGKLDLIWAAAEAYADDPARVVGRETSYGGLSLLDIDGVRYNVREQMRRARTDVTLVSPYVVPGRDGMDTLREMRERSVRISLLTNSLATTDEPLVYTAYRRYRPQMLRLGVEIWELSSTRSRRSRLLGPFGSKIERLHAKTAIFDRRTIYLGSMNLDPRSDLHNTELGLFVTSPELARQLLQLAEALKEQGAHQVRFSTDRSMLEWITGDGKTEEALRVDPDSSFWDRLRLRLIAPLVPEGLL